MEEPAILFRHTEIYPMGSCTSCRPGSDSFTPRTRTVPGMGGERARHGVDVSAGDARVACGILPVIDDGDLPTVVRQRANAACRRELAFEPDFGSVRAAHHAVPVGRPFFFSGSSARSWSFRPTLSSAASELISVSSPSTARIRR